MKTFEVSIRVQDGNVGSTGVLTIKAHDLATTDGLVNAIVAGIREWQNLVKE